jgi:CDP-diacylglycerol--serine O-phosphatidyltransferase
MSFEPENGRNIKGIYLLPNLVTTAGLFAGFYAIVSAMNNSFENAAIALFIAMVMDGLDGRIARYTDTQSEFGAQYDSLSDMVCFGVTPALVIYSWSLKSLGKLGWLVAFFYVAATALRLARFNTQNITSMESKHRRYFVGLPCPAAAAVVASIVWIGTDFGLPVVAFKYEIAVVVAGVASLMVSNLHYNNFKELDLKGKVPFMVILLTLLILLLVAWDPPKVLFIIFFFYALSGIVMGIIELVSGFVRKRAEFAEVKKQIAAKDLD